MKRTLALAALATAALTGCGAGDYTPPLTFEDKCVQQGGTVLTDSKTETITSPVISPNGGISVGVGSSRVTIALCVVDGDVVDMEVR